MLLPSAAHTLPGKNALRTLANLSPTLPPGLLLGLVRGVSNNIPRSAIDSLIARSASRLREIQASAPDLRSSAASLLEAANTSRRRCNREESALAQALLALCIGLILQMLAPSNLYSSGPPDPALHNGPLPPQTFASGFSPSPGVTHLKRPLPA